MVGWLRRAVGAFAGAPSQKAVSAFVDMIQGTGSVGPSTYADYMATGTGKSWASFKACDLIAKGLLTLPIRLTRAGTTNEVKDSPLAALLRVANPMETFSDLLYRTVFWLELTGSAYWYKSEANHDGNKPRALIGLKPQHMTIHADSQGRVKGYTYTVAGQPVPFDVDEVIHFKWPHPANDYYGIGKLEAARDLMDDQANRANWANRFWQNGAAPSGVFVRDGDADPTEFERLKARWNSEYGGKKNAGKTAWLVGKWSHIKLGLDIAEMQDIERQKLTVEQIFQLHGVPLSVAGVRDAANYATAEIDAERFKEFTLLPLARLIEQTLRSDLVAGFGDRDVLAFDVSSLINTARVVRDLTPLFDRGVVSINEMRERAGLPRDDANPIWNQHFINAGLVPLDLSGIADLGRTDAEAARTVARFTAQQPHRPE